MSVCKDIENSKFKFEASFFLIKDVLQFDLSQWGIFNPNLALKPVHT